jgi:purine-nucleoside phosphorylase
MPSNDPIVLPVRNDRAPRIGPVAILAAVEDDLLLLRQRLPLAQTRRLYLSRLYFDNRRSPGPCLVGPALGAPYAVMLLETLRSWGVGTFIFVGWCGAIQASVKIGDIVLAHSALVDEGTSLHYRQKTGALVPADATLSGFIQETLSARAVPFRQGVVWTTDGVFRETPAKVDHFRSRGAVVVDMELSALLSAAAFHGLVTAGLLAVSDELFTGTWRPGFKSPQFARARTQLVDAVAALVDKVMPI